MFQNYPGEWDKRKSGKFAWNYLLYFSHLRRKDPEEYNGGPEPQTRIPQPIFSRRTLALILCFRAPGVLITDSPQTVR